jgi:hypothetical protein
MRRHLIALSAVAALGAAVLPAAQAQTSVVTITPQQRTFFESYVSSRSSGTDFGRTANNNNGGNIALGANVPSSVTLQRFEGNPEYASYRYGRIDNRTVVTDADGRIVHIIN